MTELPENQAIRSNATNVREPLSQLTVILVRRSVLRKLLGDPMIERHDVDALGIVDVPKQHLDDHRSVRHNHRPVSVKYLGVCLNQRYVLESHNHW